MPVGQSAFRPSPMSIRLIVMRVVSLVCSNTEIVNALGMTSHLVGVDDHSDFPAEVVATLPRLGPELRIDVPAVASLRPDLVLASLSVPGHERVVEELERERLPLLVLDPVSLPDVLRDIRTVADSLDVPRRGVAVVEGMEEVFREVRGEATRDRESSEDRAPRVLIQWWPKPVIGPGRLSWVQDLLDLVGAENPLGDEEVRSRPMPDEEVAELAPKAIVISWCGVHPDKYRPDVVFRNPAWQEIPAILNRQVHCIPEAYLGRPGPRLTFGARALREVVRSVLDQAEG